MGTHNYFYFFKPWNVRGVEWHRLITKMKRVSAVTMIDNVSFV